MPSASRWVAIALIASSLLIAWTLLQGQRTELAEARAELAAAEARLATERARQAGSDAASTRQPLDASQALHMLNNTLAQNQPDADSARQRGLTAMRLSEGFQLATQARAAVFEARQLRNAWPRNNHEAGLSPPMDYRNERIHSLFVQPEGLIRIVMLHEGNPAETLYMQASTNRAGQVSWRCSSDLPDIGQIFPACTQQKSQP